MALTEALREEILKLDTNREDYRFVGKVAVEKVAMLLVGSIGSGKSTVGAEMLKLGKRKGLDIAEVGTVTTRARKPGDPPQYRTADESITHEAMIEKIKNGEMINWSWIPETGHMYGCDEESFGPGITIVPCLPDSVGQIKEAVTQTHVAYIMPDAHDWYERHKEKISDPYFQSRLPEAEASIVFAMDEDTNKNMYRVVNHHDPAMLRKLANNLIDVCTGALSSQNPYGVDRSLREGFNGHASMMYHLIGEMREKSTAA